MDNKESSVDVTKNKAIGNNMETLHSDLSQLRTQILGMEIEPSLSKLPMIKPTK